MKTIYINASSLKHRHCRRAYWATVGLGYTTNDMVEYLRFGKAVHKFAELRARMSNQEAMALAVPTYDGPDGATLVRACLAMPPEYDIGPVLHINGEKAIERKFTVQIDVRKINGEDTAIVLCGTFDRLNFSGNGILTIVDYKTTRSWNRDDIINRYTHDVQMMFYLWVAWKHSYSLFPDINVANAANQNKLAMQIGAVMLRAKPMPRWSFLPPITRTVEQFEQFDALMRDTVEDIIHEHAAQTDFMSAAADGMTNNTCSDCDFRSVCFANDDERRSYLLDTFFTRKPYDPTGW